MVVQDQVGNMEEECDLTVVTLERCQSRINHSPTSPVCLTGNKKSLDSGHRDWGTDIVAHLASCSTQPSQRRLGMPHTYGVLKMLICGVSLMQ